MEQRNAVSEIESTMVKQPTCHEGNHNLVYHLHLLPPVAHRDARWPPLYSGSHLCQADRWFWDIREIASFREHTSVLTIAGLMKPTMPSLRIVLTCVAAAVFYGIIHDLFTAHVCVEYFSIFHPPVFSTTSPTLLAIGWGVLATWWMGVFLGVLLALAARAGSRNKLEARNLIRPISKLLLVMGFLAAGAGLAGYILTRNGVIIPPQWVASVLPPARHARFMADLWAHNASYFFGLVGSLLLCLLTIRKRIARRNDAVLAS